MVCNIGGRVTGSYKGTMCTLCTICTVQCLRYRGSVEFTAVRYWVTGVGTPSVLTSAVSLAERVIGGRLFCNINALHYMFCTVRNNAVCNAPHCMFREVL